MNIFVLDYNVEKCAQYHNDRHVVKMVLESLQLLNNACTQDPNYDSVYKLTHKNHPASKWVSTSLQNFNWLCDLGLALSHEYTFRYGKIHKCQPIIELLKNSSSTQFMKDIGMTPFVLCMPDPYKTEDPVQSYRNYYMGEKRKIAQWKTRAAPEWWK